MMHSTTFLPMAAGFPDLAGHHRHLLDDRVRTEAFLRALRRAVRPGMVVADVGTGTGILAIAARRAGAARVYGIETRPIVHVARQLAAANGVDGIEWVEGDATRVLLPEKIDLVVSECFGPMAIGGSMIEAVASLAARHLRPSGSVVPGRVSLWLAPVEAPRDFAQLIAPSRRRYGLSWAALRALMTHNLYNTEIARAALLAAPACVAELDARSGVEATLSSTVEFACRRAGRVHGFAGWFEAQLSDGVRLSTAPGRPKTIWRQVFFPLGEARRVQRGTPIEVCWTATRAADARQVRHFDWSGSIGGWAFRQSTRYSVPDGWGAPASRSS